MKTLKITLALVAIVVLTVSGVQSEKVVADNELKIEKKSNLDLLATTRKKSAKPSES